MSKLSSPANEWMRDVFPLCNDESMLSIQYGARLPYLPGTPYRRYPRRNGMPRHAVYERELSHHYILPTSFGIPGRWKHYLVAWENYTRHSPIFRAQEVFAIGQEHIFDSRLQHNGTHWPLLAGSIPPPTAIGPTGAWLLSASVILRNCQLTYQP